MFVIVILGSSGGPLINSVDYKVIGIHKGGALGSKNFNLEKKFNKEDIEKMNKLEPKKLDPIKKK